MAPLIAPQAVIDNPDRQYLADRADLYAVTPLEIALAEALRLAQEDAEYYRIEWEKFHDNQAF